MEQKPERCMFCGKDESFGEMSKEHFVPKALWDGDRPIQTRTVPAHKTCNAAYSAENEYFRDILVMEDGAKAHPEVQKLHVGKIARKFEERFGSIKNTLKNMRRVPVTTPGGIYIENAPAFDVDWPRLKRVLQNVMKGIYCSTQGQPLPVGWKFEVHSADAIDLNPIKPLVVKMSPWCDFGDDVFRCRYVFDQKGAMMCVMQFYRHRAFVGWAMSNAFIQASYEHAYHSMLIDPSAANRVT